MRFAISILLFCLIGTALAVPVAADMRDKLLREYAIKNGIVRPSQLLPAISEAKSAIGKRLFEETTLSLNGDISCKACHLDEFSSADGIPNAIGVLGKGKGVERVRSKGAIVPRNTLPLWGRGSTGFNVFFWDGKVDGTTGTIHSQFGDRAPSDSPLTVAVHLPFVEIREMVVDDDAVKNSLQKEEVSAAEQIYRLLVKRLQSNEELSIPLARAFSIKPEQIEFIHVAKSIAEFIRDNFQIRETKFHRFVFGNGTLSTNERAGGLIFYGKGRCSLCHNGPFFSDLAFHSVPFPQLGFGKNGFGIDYGRFNVTFDNRDTYKFRTPPLFNVAQTAPYSHSGSIAELDDAIRLHFDPLQHFDSVNATLLERTQFYERLGAWAKEEVRPNVLSDSEVNQLVDFLMTLSF